MTTDHRQPDRDPIVVFSSPEMHSAMELAERAGASESKVLITGESGVGKELFAHIIHRHSPRAQRPLVAINCAGLTETLLESELFGHAKGSFTGAYRDKPGQLELAHGGTLFLDEVGEMSLRMQTLLLRFLENGEVQRVGGTEPLRQLDVRIIAATNRNLAERVSSGEFREDLLFRLRVIHLHVPPLRARPVDIPALLEHFASRGPRPVTFSDAAMTLLKKYRWPGNVRELQNVVEQALWRSAGDVIRPEHLPPEVVASEVLVQTRERRRQVADDLYDGVTTGGYSFWAHVHPLFLSRDITRNDIREMVRRGLQTTRGSYRALLSLFRIDSRDYQRFHNFLMAHGCKVEFREYRNGVAAPRQREQRVLEHAGASARPPDRSLRA